MQVSHKAIVTAAAKPDNQNELSKLVLDVGEPVKLCRMLEKCPSDLIPAFLRAIFQGMMQ